MLRKRKRAINNLILRYSERGELRQREMHAHVFIKLEGEKNLFLTYSLSSVTIIPGTYRRQSNRSIEAFLA